MYRCSKIDFFITGSAVLQRKLKHTAIATSKLPVSPITGTPITTTQVLDESRTFLQTLILLTQSCINLTFNMVWPNPSPNGSNISIFSMHKDVICILQISISFQYYNTVECVLNASQLFQDWNSTNNAQRKSLRKIYSYLLRCFKFNKNALGDWLH